MAGILDKTLYTTSSGILTTEEFRNQLLGRNLPPPITNSLDQSGFASKIADIASVINVPIWGITSENIPLHYDEDAQLVPFGDIRRSQFNVNNNRYIPLDDLYNQFGVIPPSEPFPDSATKVRKPYPRSSYPDQFSLLSTGVNPGVTFPFTVIDKINNLTFQNESPLGILSATELSKVVLEKKSQIEFKIVSPELRDSIITPYNPPEKEAVDYVNRLKGSELKYTMLSADAIGWQEYNTIANGGDDLQYAPTLSTEQRVNSLLGTSGLLQVKTLFTGLGLNKFIPKYTDRRLSATENAGTNSRYYIGSEASTNRGYKLTKRFQSSEFNESTDSTDATTVNEDFYWVNDGGNNFNEKTILSKTQDLVNIFPDSVFIDQTTKYFKDKVNDKLISRGNAISKESFEAASANGEFCRVWTVVDNYSYKNAIRNTGLFTSDDISKPGFSVTSDNAALSVLGQNGIVKTHPTAIDSTTSYKKYMLSIENLAWTDNLADLTMDETGPGDPLSGNRGRIMWFPPYDLAFDENMSAKWTPTDFIGRGEPVFTYNSATRSGQLRFKILVDHPRVINAYRGRRTTEIERFFAGCLSPQEFLDFVDKNQGMSVNTRNEIEKKLNIQNQQQTASNYAANKEETVLYAKNTGTGGAVDIAGITSFLSEQKNTSKSVKININGYASTDETNPEELAQERADDIKGSVVTAAQGIKGLKYVITTKDFTVDIADDPNSRRVDVKISYDAVNDNTAKHQPIESPGDLTYLPVDSQIIDNISIDETKYFDFIDENYPTYFSTISEKIKYFHPGFHSTTPEGLNTRLTFLQQCCRQGPSIYDKKETIKPQNLAFGRPPVCILRIGDFVYSKVLVQTLNITYESGQGIQWDENPEGIGVQPMMANVTMSLEIIGGQSLQGPINRLQNALSFNYYANTEMYEKRSDKIKIDAFLGARIIDGKTNIVDDLLPGVGSALKNLSLLGDSPKAGLKQDVPLNQMEVGTTINSEHPPEATIEVKRGLTIEGDDQSILIELLTDDEIASEESEIEYKISDELDDSQRLWIQEEEDVISTSYDLYDVEVFKVAFDNSILVTNKEAELATLQTQFNNETNPNVKTQILGNIGDKQTEIDDLNKLIPNVVVESYYTDHKTTTRKLKTFTIKDNKLV